MMRTVSLQWPRLVSNVCVDVLATCFVLLLLFSCKESAVALDHTELRGNAMEWRSAIATWYGSPDGDGSDGGACGYGTLVDQKPLRATVGAVSPDLFHGGEGCGACSTEGTVLCASDNADEQTNVVCDERDSRALVS